MDPIVRFDFWVEKRTNIWYNPDNEAFDQFRLEREQSSCAYSIFHFVFISQYFRESGLSKFERKI